MAKTISLVDLKVTQLRVDYERQTATVDFQILDASGNVWQTGQGQFWVTLPSPAGPLDFQLGSSYIPILVQLQTDAKTALINRVLV